MVVAKSIFFYLFLFIVFYNFIEKLAKGCLCAGKAFLLRRHKCAAESI